MGPCLSESVHRVSCSIWPFRSITGGTKNADKKRDRRQRNHEANHHPAKGARNRGLGEPGTQCCGDELRGRNRNGHPDVAVLRASLGPTWQTVDRWSDTR